MVQIKDQPKTRMWQSKAIKDGSEKAQRRILIVEDEKPIAYALDLKLTHAGFKIKIAENGEEGLRLLEKEEFDLILLDLVMPKMDGFTFLQKLRAENNHTKVIVISNLSQSEDVQKVKAFGVLNYFVKSNTPIKGIVEHVKKVFQ